MISVTPQFKLFDRTKFTHFNCNSCFLGEAFFVAYHRNNGRRCGDQWYSKGSMFGSLDDARQFVASERQGERGTRWRIDHLPAIILESTRGNALLSERCLMSLAPFIGFQEITFENKTIGEIVDAFALSRQKLFIPGVTKDHILKREVQNPKNAVLPFRSSVRESYGWSDSGGFSRMIDITHTLHVISRITLLLQNGNFSNSNNGPARPALN